jgi:hypothetical protein
MFTLAVEKDFQFVILGWSCADKTVRRPKRAHRMKYLWWFVLDWCCEGAVGQLRVEDVGWRKQGNDGNHRG